MDTDSFTVYVKIDDIYKDIAEDVETRLETTNYELEYNSIERPLPEDKNKIVIGLMKDKWANNKWTNNKIICWIKRKNI